MADPKITKALAAYFAKQPPGHRKILKRIRADIRSAAPKCEDYMSYGIPAVKSDGTLLAWYAGFRNHISMFPMGPEILRAAKVKAADYVTSKGTIQFPIDEPPSSALVKRLVKARLAAMKAAR